MLLILSGFVRNIWIDPCVPASKGDPKLREEEFGKGIRL